MPYLNSIRLIFITVRKQEFLIYVWLGRHAQYVRLDILKHQESKTLPFANHHLCSHFWLMPFWFKLVWQKLADARILGASLSS